MTTREWLEQRIEITLKHQREVEEGKTTLDLESWRKQRGYVVNGQPGRIEP